MPLDNTGYSSPSLTELVTNMSTNLKALLGTLMDTSSSSVAGHVQGVTAIEVAKVFEDLRELFANTDPTSSEGRMLENMCNIMGLIRKGLVHSTGVVTIEGTNGTVIPDSTVVLVDGDSDRRFLTQGEWTLGTEGTIDIVVVAESTGATQAPIGTLNSLETTIAGVTLVTNAREVDVGTDTVESDEQLRIRKANTVTIGGNSTPAAIRAALEQLYGVTTVIVVTNKTSLWVPRGDDLYNYPPNSMEAIVEGGSEQEIVETLAMTSSGTSEQFGLLSALYEDITGNTHQIRFSRPESTEVFINVDYQLYDEEVFPEDGGAQIAIAIQEFAAKEYIIGKDVLTGRLSTPCFTVPGISNVNITVGLTAVALSSDDIPMALFQKALISNITTNQI